MLTPSENPPTVPEPEKAEAGRFCGQLAVLGIALVTATLFLLLAVLSTQDKSIRAVSPWQDDPYDTAVSIGLVAVPILGVVICARLMFWRAPGQADRAQQTIRAAMMMTALVALTTAVQWSGVLVAAHHSSWNETTRLLVLGLSAISLLVAGTTVLLIRFGVPRGSAAHWRHDWLDDLVRGSQNVPLLRQSAIRKAAAWARLHTLRLFALASLFSAILVVGSLAIGEQWNAPLLIGWALAVEASAMFAFCIIANAIVGFVRRPPRARRQRVIERAITVGCITVQLAVAFHDNLWAMAAPGATETLPVLAASTLGPGVIATLLTTAVALAMS